MSQVEPAPVVLVVDDEEMTRRLVGAVLAKGGYDCLFAARGDEGLEMARANCPKLIILDIMMPGLNGFEVMRYLKASPSTSSIPVIFLTGQVHQADRNQAMNLGAVDYVEKPFDRHELLTRVDAYVKTSRLKRNLNYYNERLTRLAHEALALLSTSTKPDTLDDTPVGIHGRLLVKIDAAVDQLALLNPSADPDPALTELRAQMAEIRDLADHLAIIAGWTAH
ncbi:MAG: response regulator [Deltaproteobacteria bacterium]|jgi:DNA-binding response OmpR family regulator|nr:response regulator [Deltaproteobacteria bacterium]